MAELARRARYGVLLVNDSDIVVDPGYFRAVTAPLEDAEVAGLAPWLDRLEGTVEQGRWQQRGKEAAGLFSSRVSARKHLRDLALLDRQGRHER